MTDFTNTDNAFIKLRERTEYSGRHGKGNPAGGCGTAISVLNAYTNTVLQILRGGSAVKFGELGTFLHHRQRNGGKRNRQACAYRKFSAPQILKSAVQNVGIRSLKYVASAGVITQITDVATGRTDGTLTAGGSALLKGEGLKTDSGIRSFFLTNSGGGG